MTIIGAGIGNLPSPTEYSHDADVCLKRPYRFSRDRNNFREIGVINHTWRKSSGHDILD